MAECIECKKPIDPYVGVFYNTDSGTCHGLCLAERYDKIIAAIKKARGCCVWEHESGERCIEHKEMEAFTE